MKNFKQYNESVTDLLKPKSNDEILNLLDGLDGIDRISMIQRYGVEDEYLTDEEKSVINKEATKFKNQILNLKKGDKFSFLSYTEPLITDDEFSNYEHMINVFYDDKVEIVNFDVDEGEIVYEDESDKYELNYEELNIKDLIKLNRKIRDYINEVN